MADLKFSQPEHRNFATPILIALAILIVTGGLVYRFTPHRTAQVSVQKVDTFASHIVIKSDSLLVGRDTVQDDLYVFVTLKIDDQLRLPLFIKNFTAVLTPSNPDGTPAEDLTASAVEKTDIPNLYMSFPALKAKAIAQASPLLLRETQIEPGTSASGMIVLHFPIDPQTWDKRKSASFTIDFYHQQPLTIAIPKP